MREDWENLENLGKSGGVECWEVVVLGLWGTNNFLVVRDIAISIIGSCAQSKDKHSNNKYQPACHDEKINKHTFTTPLYFSREFSSG